MIELYLEFDLQFEIVSTDATFGSTRNKSVEFMNHKILECFSGINKKIAPSPFNATENFTHGTWLKLSNTHTFCRWGMVGFSCNE